MPAATSLQTASSHYAESALLAAEAVQLAAQARPRGIDAVLAVIARYQGMQAFAAEFAVQMMLAEQEVSVQADAMLNALAFTTAPDVATAMIDATETDAEFELLVESLTQDAGRSAESVATAVRPHIVHVRYLTPPSCSRCVALAGRVYRYSEGFLRHPNCDCVMVPCTVAAPLEPIDPLAMFERGEVSGLSKADAQALRDGADFGQIVNVRRKKAGLRDAGEVLARAGRPTPAGIYRMAGDDRAKAVALLKRYGYVL